MLVTLNVGNKIALDYYKGEIIWTYFTYISHFDNHLILVLLTIPFWDTRNHHVLVIDCFHLVNVVLVDVRVKVLVKCVQQGNYLQVQEKIFLLGRVID